MKITVTWAQFEVLKKQVLQIQDAVALSHNKGEAVNTYEVKWDKKGDEIEFELPD